MSVGVVLVRPVMAIVVSVTIEFHPIAVDALAVVRLVVVVSGELR